MIREKIRNFFNHVLFGIKSFLNNIPFISDFFITLYKYGKNLLWDHKFYEENINKNAPARRTFTVAHVKLRRGLDKLGCFVPELYVLASAGGLKAQIEEKEWIKSGGAGLLKVQKPELYQQLYRETPEGSIRKSAFELALVRTLDELELDEIITAEFQFRRDNFLGLPAHISKQRAKKDYLKNIEEIGLNMKGDPNGDPFARTINIKNKPKNAKLIEKIFHFLGPKIALLTTFTGAVVLSASFSSFWVLGAVFLAAYYANKVSDDFGKYDLAEALSREIDWLVAKDIPWKGRAFHFGNMFKTIGKLTATAIISVFAALAAWEGILELPWAVFGANHVTLGMQIGIASVFAVLGGISTFLSLATAQRYVWNLSFFDNQIPLADVKEVTDALPALGVAKQKREDEEDLTKSKVVSFSAKHHKPRSKAAPREDIDRKKVSHSPSK